MSTNCPEMQSLVTRLADRFGFDLRVVDGGFSVGVAYVVPVDLTDVSE